MKTTASLKTMMVLCLLATLVPSVFASSDNTTPDSAKSIEILTTEKSIQEIHNDLACFMHEGCRGGLRRDEIAAMVLMAA
jgi:hypothetical protein